MTQPSAPTDLDRQVLDFLQRAFDVVRSGDAAELGHMLDQGLPVNVRNQKGDNLLMLATYHGHLDATRLLLSRGADASVANDMGQTPLQAAAFKGEVSMVRLLLDHGADVESRGPTGRTALMFAAMFDRLAIMELLVERGADLRARDEAGTTPLDAARTMNAQQAAHWLEQRLVADSA